MRRTRSSTNPGYATCYEWSGPEGTEGEEAPTGVVLAVEAPAPHAGRP